MTAAWFSEACVTTGSIARRYARALLDLAAEDSQLDAVGEHLADLAAVVRESRELAEVFQDPAFSRAQRHAVLDALCARLETDRRVIHLAHLLVDRNRVRHLGAIARAYRDLADARAGRVHARVVTAVDLPAAAAARLEKSLARAADREVVLERQVEPALLGGVVAHVGGRVYDGSLKTQLDRMKRQLMDR